MCELSLARGIPVLQEMALSVLRQTEWAKAVPLQGLADYFAVGAWLAGREDVVKVTRECRDSFERAFGWDSQRQVEAEGVVRRTLVGFPTVGGVLPLPPRSRWVEAVPGLYEAWFDAHI